MRTVRVYCQKPSVSSEDQCKLALSRQEAKELMMRDINCPYCGFLVDRVFSDVAGHKMVFCKKCKEEYPVNLGYFRRMRAWRRKHRYRRERQKR